MGRSIFSTFGAGFLLSVVMTAGAAAEEPLKCQGLRKQIELLIEDSSRCAEDSDCVIEYPGCPFGCAVPLNQEKLSGIRTQIGDYASQCQLCEYKCARMPNQAICEKQRCARSNQFGLKQPGPEQPR